MTQQQMAVFVVVATRNTDAIEEQVKDLVSEDSQFRLREGVWLVDYDGTTRTLAEKLRIRDERPVGSGVVFSIANYSGRTVADVWEWLKKRPIESA
jgi:DNA polymerase III delta prime subunit